MNKKDLSSTPGVEIRSKEYTRIIRTELDDSKFYPRLKEDLKIPKYSHWIKKFKEANESNSFKSGRKLYKNKRLEIEGILLPLSDGMGKRRGRRRACSTNNIEADLKVDGEQDAVANPPADLNGDFVSAKAKKIMNSDYFEVNGGIADDLDGGDHLEELVEGELED